MIEKLVGKGKVGSIVENAVSGGWQEVVEMGAGVAAVSHSGKLISSSKNFFFFFSSLTNATPLSK